MSITAYPFAVRPSATDQRIEAESHSLYELCDIHDLDDTGPHDGVSAITVRAVDWRAQFNELWVMLVPRVGVASTVQGEVIRSVGRLHAELTSTITPPANCNRAALVDWLARILDAGIHSPYNPVRVQRVLAQVNVGTASEHELDELVRYGVRWVLANPQPRQLTT